MKNKSICILFIYSLLCIHMQAQSFQPDWQAWTAVGIKKDFKKGFSAEAQYQIRFDHDFQTFKASYISAGLNYKLNRYVSFCLGYRFATSVNADQHRFSGGMELKYGIKKWDFDLRLLYQNDRDHFNARYLDMHPTNNYIRTRLSISKSFKKHYEVYVSCEPFWFVSQQKFELNKIRNMLGFKYDFKKYHQIDIAFLFQPDMNQSHPTWVNAINIGYEFTIPKWKKFHKSKKH